MSTAQFLFQYERAEIDRQNPFSRLANRFDSIQIIGPKYIAEKLYGSDAKISLTSSLHLLLVIWSRR
jgi:hypothetical protein